MLHRLRHLDLGELGPDIQYVGTRSHGRERLTGRFALGIINRSVRFHIVEALQKSAGGRLCINDVGRIGLRQRQKRFGVVRLHGRGEMRGVIHDKVFKHLCVG